jgi:Flp pilus assembly protein TadG
MLPYFLAIVGLAIDGGIVFNARRELQNVADGAARAGAEQLNLQAYRDTNGADVELDRASALRAAYDYLDAYAPGLPREATAAPHRVVVTVQTQVPAVFLRVVGISSAPVVATAPAEAFHGVEQGSP